MNSKNVFFSLLIIGMLSFSSVAVAGHPITDRGVKGAVVALITATYGAILAAGKGFTVGKAYGATFGGVGGPVGAVVGAAVSAVGGAAVGGTIGLVGMEFCYATYDRYAKLKEGFLKQF